MQVCLHFLFLHDLVFVGCSFLKTHPFLLGYPVCWHIIDQSSLLQSLNYCGISFNVFSLISDFFESSLFFSWFNLGKVLSILLNFAKSQLLFYFFQYCLSIFYFIYFCSKLCHFCHLWPSFVFFLLLWDIQLGCLRVSIFFFKKCFIAVNFLLHIIFVHPVVLVHCVFVFMYLKVFSNFSFYLFFEPFIVQGVI